MVELTQSSNLHCAKNYQHSKPRRSGGSLIPLTWGALTSQASCWQGQLGEGGAIPRIDPGNKLKHGPNLISISHTHAASSALPHMPTPSPRVPQFLWTVCFINTRHTPHTHTHTHTPHTHSLSLTKIAWHRITHYAGFVLRTVIMTR